MTTYKEIFGKQIKNLSSDPPAAAAEGQVWYNTGSNVFKTSLSTSVWASGGNFPDSRRAGFSAGTQTASFYAGGYTSGTLTSTKIYNGSSWTAGPTFNESKFLGACSGISTAAIASGGNGPAGSNLASSATFDGSSWTATSAVPVGNQGGSGFGILAASVTIGGSGDNDYSAEWNGSSWAAGNNCNVGRYGAGGSGTLTAGLVSGGENPGATAQLTSSSYDGTNWTAGASLVESKTDMFGGSSLASAGTSGTLISGGNNDSGRTGNCQIFNGTAFVTTASLATARYGNQTGDSTTALFAAGYNASSANTNAVEEFTTSIGVRTLTSS